MRLDHLLSKEEEVGVVLLSSYQGARATGRSRRQMLCLHKQLHRRTYRHRRTDRAGIDGVKTGESRTARA